MSHKELIKDIVHDLINGTEDQAAVKVHDLFIMKSQDIAGLGSARTAEADHSDLEQLAAELEAEEAAMAAMAAEAGEATEAAGQTE